MKRSLIYGIFLLIILSGCSFPSEPGVPTWYTSLKLYMLNDSYDLIELAEEDSAIVVTEIAGGDSVLGIYQEEYDEQDLDIGVTDPVSETEYAEIGDIELPDVEDISGILLFGDFSTAAGLNLPSQGTEVPEIPSFLFGLVEQELEPVEEIEYVTILDGGMHLRITNNMIIGLGDYENGDPFKLRLVNINGSDTLDVIPEIVLDNQNLPSGAVYEEDVDLNGITLYQNMSLLLTGGSLGSEGQSVIIDYDSELITDISFEIDMTAENANCMIDEQTINDTTIIEFDEDYRLYYAEINDDSANYLSLYIENEIDLELMVDIDIPMLFIDGSAYNTQIVIPRSTEGGVFEMELDLGGAHLGDDVALMETIEVFTSAHVDSTAEGDYRYVDHLDSYNIIAEISELDFSYVRGIIEAQEQETISEEINLEISYPEIEDGALFEFNGDSEIRIHAETGNSQIPGELTIDARAYNSESEMVQLLTFDGNIPVVEIPAENEFLIIFSSDEYNINELLSILPERIEFNVDVTAGDGQSEVIYQMGDKIATTIELESTLALAANAWLVPTEDNEILIQDEDIELEEEQYDAFVEASLHLTYINTTGMSVMGEILLADSEEDVASEIYNFDNPDLEKVNIIEIPQLSTTSGAVTDSLEIVLEQSDLDYFLSDITYMSSRLKLMSPGDQPLGGEVQLIGKAMITIKVSDELINDDEEE